MQCSFLHIMAIGVAMASVLPPRYYWCNMAFSGAFDTIYL